MKTTRRQFLLTTSAAGLAAALPPIPVVPPRLPAPLRRRAAEDELRVAVIGLRGRGWHHVQAFERLPHVSVTALCDCDCSVLDRRGRAFSDRYGRDALVEADYRVLLDRADIDIVSIATPNHWHALMTMDACLAGKDVYVEKPVTHNLDEGRLLLDVVARSGRLVQCGFQSRSAPAIRRGIEWLREGHLGPVRPARGLCYKPRRSIGRCGGPAAVPDHIDYDLWTGPAPMKPLRRTNLHYDWHWDFDTGNGDLGNQGVHQIDICRWAIDARAMPRSVTSIGGRFGYRDDGRTPNTQVVLYDFAAAPVLFEVRGLPRDRAAQSGNWGDGMDVHGGQRIASIIHCEGGDLIVPTGANDCWAVDRDGRRIESWSRGADHFENFIRAVRTRQEHHLHADVLEGVRSSDLCHLGLISQRLARPGRLPEAVAARPAFGEAVQRMSLHLEANGIESAADALEIGPTLDINQTSDRFIDAPKADSLRLRRDRHPFTYPNHS